MRKSGRPGELILIRHPESARDKARKGSIFIADENARKGVAGAPDHEIALTPDGREQARQTGACLCANHGAPDYLHHSGYRRTVQTAEGILCAYPENQRTGIKVRANQFIRERDPGFAYDMTDQEAAVAFPWLQEYWRTFGGYFARPHGARALPT
jgi:broad specificity phosphatase PhoE